MSVVGSLIFCTDCGNLLPSVTDKDASLECSQCKQQYSTERMEKQAAPAGCYTNEEIGFANLKVVTKSAEDAFPSTLKLKRSEVKAVLSGDDDVEDGATIQEKCPQCGNPEMTYQTLQLRSADEGATVFFTCPKCRYKFRQNN